MQIVQSICMRYITANTHVGPFIIYFLIKFCKSVFKNVEVAIRSEVFVDTQLYNDASVWWQLEGVSTCHSSTAAEQRDNGSSVLTFHIIVRT